MSIDYYKLNAKFCTHHYKNGDVCIFVHESKDFNYIPIHNICKEKDLEISVIKLNLPKIKIALKISIGQLLEITTTSWGN
jgi:hypothetical protein